MSLNKFMHPRNRYRKPPDFKVLAIKYLEFRKFAKQDISGKVTLNFKDLEAVRALTSVLLKEDFGLDVEIPLNRLIPTLPLRLNYLLWIEDLLESNERKSDVKGIDIGCGASCVYPLLAAKQFHWTMLATEVDTDSAFIAAGNVRRNNLQNMITVRVVKEDQFLEGVINPDTTYDFCICNPPFFSSPDELDPKNVSRSPNRPPPRNAHSGAINELVVEGGEIAFVSKIIEESIKLKDKVRIYSAMMGHKTSVPKLQQFLKKSGISVTATSNFCQGRTTRWGLAWSLDPSTSLPSSQSECRKQKSPLSHVFEAELPATIERLKILMELLQISYRLTKNSDDVCKMIITAMKNTWTNSRKKRRQEMLKQKLIESSTNKEINSEPSSEERNKSENTNEISKVISNSSEKKQCGDSEDLDTKSKNNSVTADQQNHTVNCDPSITDQSTSGNKEMMKRDNDESNESAINKCKEDSYQPDCNPPKKPKLEYAGNTRTNEIPLYHGTLSIKRSDRGSVVELDWLSGAGGRDSAHQILQYFKNNFHTH